MNVMLSYRSSDWPFVEELASFLSLQGIEPWIDREEIAPFAQWRGELLAELRQCDKLIAVLSPAYLASEHCRMEAFIARSYGRPILPIMLEECFAALRDHEETKGLEELFMVQIDKTNAFGLPIDRNEAHARIQRALMEASEPVPVGEKLIYLSYATPDAAFAHTLAQELSRQGVATWIGTRDIHVGERWREAQARAMMRATAHLVVLDEDILSRHVLHTEILLAEARGLPVLPVLSPRLQAGDERVPAMLDSLKAASPSYQRLWATNYLVGEGKVTAVAGRIASHLAR